MELAAIFSDHMVLQRGRPIRLFGTGTGEGWVSFLGEKHLFSAQNDRWSVELPARPAGGPYAMAIGLGEEVTVIQDIYIGDVWLAAGQSNMEFRVRESATVLEDVADIPPIRCYSMPRPTTPFLPRAWIPSAREAALDFTAVGYAFAKSLHSATGVPIGIISCNQGASRIESWTEQGMLEQENLLLPPEQTHEDAKVFPFNPPGFLYETMLKSLAPYTLRGVLWYQGESNRGKQEVSGYAARFAALQKNWRALWQDSQLPFLTVQLAAFEDPSPLHGEENWAVLREQQVLAMRADAHTAIITTGDISDRQNIHPFRKREIGERLALAARALLYNEKVEFCGPLLREASVEAAHVILRFDHAENGLVLREECEDFYILNAAGEEFPAQATIRDEKELVVWSEAVPCPAGVKLGFRNWFTMPLYNREGLPASPFRWMLPDRA